MDIEKTCIKCKKPFKITPVEQALYRDSFTPLPKLCQRCTKLESPCSKEKKFNYYKKLMYHAKPCSAKKQQPHDTDGMHI